MPGKNKNPLLGWHPPAGLAAWARAEAASRGVPLAAILTEALAAWRHERTHLDNSTEEAGRCRQDASTPGTS